MLPQSLINLSKATRLKDTQLGCGRLTVQLVIMTLQTVNSKHRDLRQISIDVSDELALGGTGANIRKTVGETMYEQWLDLDRLLVQFWTSRSIRPTIVYTYASQDERRRFIVYRVYCRRSQSEE